MNSQDTIEDPTLYQNMLAANVSDQSNEEAVIEDDLYSIGSASQILESSECEKDSHDGEEDKERMRGQARDTEDSVPDTKLDRVLLVSQLNLNLIRLDKCVEEMASSIERIMKRLEELKDDLRNDNSKFKDSPQRRQQERGTLKRVKEQRDDSHQLTGRTRREVKKARVTWEG